MTPTAKLLHSTARGLALGLVFLLAAGSMSARADSIPRPAGIQDDVNFWIRVYTEVTTHEGFLHDVVCIGLAAQDCGGSPKGPVEPSGDQRLECVDVAARGALHQILVPSGHHADAFRHVHTIRTSADVLGLGIGPN